MVLAPQFFSKKLTEEKKTAWSDVGSHPPQAFFEANQVLEVSMDVT